MLDEVADDAVDLLLLHLDLELFRNLAADVGRLAPPVQERRDDERERRQDDLVLEQLFLVVEDDEDVLAFVLVRDDLQRAPEVGERHGAILPRDRDGVY